MNDKFIMSARQSAELDHAFERNGWTSEDVKWLSTGKNLQDILKIRHGLGIVCNFYHIIDCDARPKVPEGCSLGTHQKGGKLEWNPSKVELVRYPGQEERRGYAQGKQLQLVLKCAPVLNANVRDFLYEHQDLIPSHWRKQTVFFWGTTFIGGKDEFVPALHWVEGKWYKQDRWIGSNWGYTNPAAVLRS
jgi:hypothetical protein